MFLRVDYITTVIKDSDGSYVWMHYEKDKKEKKKEKKKKKK